MIVSARDRGPRSAEAVAAASRSRAAVAGEPRPARGRRAPQMALHSRGHPGHPPGGLHDQNG